MIELNIVKAQYEQMTDNELQVFAVNESDKLTIESFHLLREEFGRRGLDLGILESAEIDKALVDLNKKTAFEKNAEKEFTEALWQYALNEKELGKNNYEIYNGLIQKGVDEKYAFMLVQSLGSVSHKLQEDYSTEITISWIFFSIGLLVIFLAINENVSGRMGLYGLLVIGAAIFRLFKSYSKRDKYKKITENVNEEYLDFDRD